MNNHSFTLAGQASQRPSPKEKIKDYNIQNALDIICFFFFKSLVIPRTRKIHNLNEKTFSMNINHILKFSFKDF